MQALGLCEASQVITFYCKHFGQNCVFSAQTFIYEGDCNFLGRLLL
jgi:hypothetical protein